MDQSFPLEGANGMEWLGCSEEVKTKDCQVIGFICCEVNSDFNLFPRFISPK
jgi:hypothetical protein